MQNKPRPKLNLNLLPRLELREPAFRRFESLIARACSTSGVLTINPRTDLLDKDGTSMNAHTFCLRFRDAILGFKRFKYHTSLIPSEFDLDLLKCSEDADGVHVHIENQLSSPLTSKLNKSLLLEILRRKRLEPPDPEVYGKEFLIPYLDSTERDWILQQAGTMGEDVPEKQSVSII